MNYSVVLLFALAVAASLSTGNATTPQVPCNGCADNSLRLGLGTLLAKYISDCVSTVVQFILQIVLQFIPGNIPVPIGAIVAQLQYQPSPNVCILLQTAANAIGVGVDIEAILSVAPVAIINTPIDLNSLLQFLAPTLAQCGSDGTVPFSQAAQLMGQYLTQQVSIDLEGLLNFLPFL